jgi:hypothetical protein
VPGHCRQAHRRPFKRPDRIGACKASENQARTDMPSFRQAAPGAGQYRPGRAEGCTFGCSSLGDSSRRQAWERPSAEAQKRYTGRHPLEANPAPPELGGLHPQPDSLTVARARPPRWLTIRFMPSG